MKHINHKVIATLGVAQVTDNPTMKHIIEIAAVAMATEEITSFICCFDEDGKYEHDDAVNFVSKEARTRMKDYEDLFCIYGVDLEVIEDYLWNPIGEILCRL